MKKLRNKKQTGFTLIELLVVIAIIGLLASVVLLSLNSARAKSRDAKRIADVRQLASAMELYYNDYAAYPTGSGAAAGAILGSTAGVGLTPTYIGQIPTAPGPQDTGGTGSYSPTVSGSTCNSVANAQGSNVYWYQAPVNGSTYTLTFCLGGVTGGYNAGVHWLSPAGVQ